MRSFLRSFAAVARRIPLVVGYLRRHGPVATVARLVDRGRLGLVRLCGGVPPGVWNPPPGDPSGPPADARYAAWQVDNVLTEAAAARLRAALAQAGSQPGAGLPRFSVIMPVYNTPVSLLDQAIASVCAQIYPDWELCVADDASTDCATVAALRRWAAAEPRIRVDFRRENGNISRATNAAAALARGDFLAFLDHDDLLTPDALAEMALAVAAHPDADFLYSDDDKIDMTGRRYAPQFKPGWSPVWLLSYMYIGHLKVVRRTLFDDLGGFRVGFEGSQDYDFALRAGESARRVVHVPKILYHWRSAPGSTAVSGDAKPAAFATGQRAVAEALARRGIAAEVVRPPWAIAGRLGLFVPQFPPVPPSGGMIATVRCGGEATVVRAATADFLLFVDPDLRPADPAWLAQMLGYARMPGVGAVGARQLGADGRLREAGLSWGRSGARGGGWAGGLFAGALATDYGYLLQMVTARECAGVGFACLLTPRRLYGDYLDHLARTGRGEALSDPLARGLDYGAWLAEAGLSCVYCPTAELRWSAGTGKGGSLIPVDPAPGHPDPWHNPNLGDDEPIPRVRPYHHPPDDGGGPPVRVMFAAAGPPGRRWAAAMAELATAGGIDPNIPWRTAEDGRWHFPADASVPMDTSVRPEVLCAVGRGAFRAVATAADAQIPSLWFMNDGEDDDGDDGDGAAGDVWRSWRQGFAFLPHRERAAACACFAAPYRVIFDTAAAAAAWAPLVTRFNATVIVGTKAVGRYADLVRQARHSRGQPYSGGTIPFPGDGT
jgi:GT2 family glycosyltransferase